MVGLAIYRAEFVHCDIYFEDSSKGEFLPFPPPPDRKISVFETLNSSWQQSLSSRLEITSDTNLVKVNTVRE